MTRTQAALDQLRAYESRNVTFIDPDRSWPIVWERAQGMHVWDAEGRKYIDLTGAFGVAAAGHANRRVVRAAKKQMTRLLHAMGDVHPHRLKGELARELSRLTFERWMDRVHGKTVFSNSGFEAVETALKTALLFTGKPGIIAFEQAYHGLGYGALNATHRTHFREPFREQLAEFGSFIPFPHDPAALDTVERALRTRLQKGDVGAILVEPLQTRGGINIPPAEFLPLLRRLCDEFKAVLILDEIYTGFGRTGRWFACEHGPVVPDIICLGKALTGGFPLSACVGRADLMDAAWPESKGEAIHTSTFLGHPVGCAMALAQIAEIRERDLVSRSARLGTVMRALLEKETGSLPLVKEVRGLGLIVGLEVRQGDALTGTDASVRIIKKMLQRGFILLPAGPHGEVISFTPPLIITETQIRKVARALAEVLAEVNRA